MFGSIGNVARTSRTVAACSFTTGIREEDFQTILMQYIVLKDTIISMVENLDAVRGYIICQDDN